MRTLLHCTLHSDVLLKTCCNCLNVYGECLTCCTDPVNIPIELSFELLLPPELDKLHPILDSLSLLGKLPEHQSNSNNLQYCLKYSLCLEVKRFKSLSLSIKDHSNNEKREVKNSMP